MNELLVCLIEDRHTKTEFVVAELLSIRCDPAWAGGVVLSFSPRGRGGTLTFHVKEDAEVACSDDTRWVLPAENVLRYKALAEKLFPKQRSVDATRETARDSDQPENSSGGGAPD